MPGRGPENELLKAALSCPGECPPLDELEQLLQEGATTQFRAHVDICPRCQTELQMLRSFMSNHVPEHERRAVAAIEARLRTSFTAVPTAQKPAETGHALWKRFFTLPWLTPLTAALAIVLVVAGVTIELRRGRQPSLDTVIGNTETLRSPTIAVLRPIGDLKEKPSEIRWEAAPSATLYRVRIMGVDHAELWSAETPTASIDLPASAEELIIPAKTLLVQVAAFDATGGKVADSELVRFRLLQNVRTH